MHFRKSTLECQINVYVGINVRISDEFYKKYKIKMHIGCTVYNKLCKHISCIRENVQTINQRNSENKK